jgi:TP901 family phage tail tape measure protein
MAAPINLPVNAQLQNQTQLERQLRQATQALRINFATGNSARSLGALSQPLGRLTGQADEFSKSLDAANARVLAFGASVGVVNAVSNAFKSLVSSTIEVEKAITAISVVGDQFAGKNKQLSQGLFAVAKATGQSFQEVSKAALEFSRQGLSLEQTLQRTQDALVLTRLTGLDAAKSVEGLTASVNAFAKAGLSTTQILNKLAAVDQAFAVSSADLIDGFSRSAAVAQNAGVTFDELAGIITALQQETSRGGAVIGNALKTIFTRLQDTSTLNQLRGLGVAVQDLEGNLLPARQILQNLAKDVEGLGQITRAGIFKDVAGTFQINQLISLVGDLNKENSVAAAATKKAAGATNEAFVANEKLNQSLDAIINKVALTGKQLGALLGEIGLGDNLKGILDGINSFLEGATNLLQGDDLGSRFAKGIIKGIGSVLTGPGIGLFLAIIAKLSFDLAKFGVQSLKTFFGIGQAAKQQQQVQESIVQTLIRNQSVLSQILNTQGGQNAQALAFLNILRQEEQVLQNIRTIAGGIAAPLIAQGYRAGAQGIQRRSAGGYLPAQEASDVRRGVGGASPSSKVVAIPNFAFGGGKRGTMIANTSEYIVPNYAGGGSAIFNQDMVKTMGLPPGAKKISASSGFIPNFKLKNKEAIEEGKDFEKKLNKKFFGKESYSPNETLDFPLPMGFGNDDRKKIELGISSLSKYGDAKRSFNRQNSVSLIDKYLRTSEGQQDFLKSRTDEKGFIKLNPKGLSMLFLYGNENLQNTIYAGTKNKSFSVSTENLINSKLSRTKNPNLSRTIKMPLIADKINPDILNASGGYIPNFANYVYDSDRLGGDKQKILQAILDSTKKKDLLVGPAGAGKSTLGSGLGTFISSIDDISKASSFTILSGAALTKEKGLSQDLRAKLAAVQASGGKVSYLGVTNQELLSRREKRATGGSVEGDLRSAAQLAGSKFAPLNQGAFIKQLKRSSSNFELLRESKKNAATNQQLAILGLYGENGNIDGSPVYTLKSQRPNLFKDIEGNLKKNVTNLVKAYASRIAKKIGIPVGSKDIKKSLTQIPSLSGYMFEDVLNQLAGPNFDTATESSGSRIDFPLTKNLREVFGVTGTQIYAEAKLNPYSGDALKSIAGKQLALAGGAQGPVERSGDLISGLKAKYLAYKNLPGRTKGNTGNKALFNEIVLSLGLDPTTPRDTLVRQVERSLGAAAGGYIPNFAASALLDAISREKSAGLNASQIYVDQSPALKSSSNPMGLMVANRRDEPAGGFQGISRARKEGMNPKTYGAARGFVPNYASSVKIGEVDPIKGVISKQAADTFNKALQEVAKKLKTNAITLTQAEQEITQLAKQTRTTKKGQQELESAGKKLAGTFLERRKEAAKQLRSGRNIKNNDAPTGQFADTAGKIFLLQSALSFLTGAVGDTENSFAKIATEATSAAGNISSLILFGNEIKNIKVEATGFKGALGNFAKGLGIAGVAFGVVSQGLKFANFAIKEFSGENAKAALASSKLADASGKLALQFDSLSKTRQVETTAQAEKILGSAGYEGFFNGIANIFRSEKLGGGDIGADPEVRKAIAQLLALGASTEEVNKVLQGARKTETVTNVNRAGEVSTQTRDITQLSDIRNGLLQAVESGIGQQRSEQLRQFRASLSSIDLSLPAGMGQAQKAAANAYGVGRFTDLNPQKKELVKEEIKAQQQLNKSKQDEQKIQNATNFGERLTLEIAKKRVESVLEIAKLNAEAVTDEEARIQLQEQTLELSNRQKILNETRLKQLDLEKKKQVDIINSIGAAISKAQEGGLSVSADNLAGLEKTLQGINFSNISSENFDTLANQLATTYLGGVNETTLAQAKNILNNVREEQKIREGINKTTGELIIVERGRKLQIDGINQALASQLSTLDRIASTAASIGGLNISGIDLENAQTKAQITRLQAQLQNPNLTVGQQNTINTQINSLEQILNLRDKNKAAQEKENQVAEIGIDIAKKSEEIARTSAALALDPFDPANLEKLKNAQTEFENLQRKLQIVENTYASTTITLDANADALKTQADLIGKVAGAYASLQKQLEAFRLGAGERVAGAQLEALGATDIDSLAKAGIRTDIEAQAQGQNLNNADYYKFIQEGTRLREIQYDIAVAESETRRRELEYELKYTQELIDLKARGASEAELQAARIRQIEEQRGGRRGFEKGIDAIQDRINNYKTTLGEEIPNLFSQNLAQGLNDAISGAKSLKEALRDAATSFFQAITQRNIQNLADVVTGGVGGFFTKKASGGLISGGSGAKDDVPAMLMGGEYVIKKSAVKKYGSGFFDALNKGSVKGFANGGGVQSGAGGFYVPGDYGEGSIRGKGNLLAFAGQSFTSGQYDRFGSTSLGGASVSLEAESARLTAFGRENSPLFERVQQSKEEAFKVYLDQLNQEKQYRDQLKQIEKAEKERQKQLITSVVSAVATTVASIGASAFAAGGKNALGAANAAAKAGGQTLGIGAKIGTFLKGGVGFGGQTGTGGLGNLFSGNFSKAFTNFGSLAKAGGMEKPNYIMQGGLLKGINVGGTTFVPTKTQSFAGPSLPTNSSAPYSGLLPPPNWNARASGGMIYGGSGTRDDVPAMLTGGEFVLNNRATRKLGVQNLNRLNAGETGGGEDRSGAVTESLLSKLDELIQATRESSSENVVVNVSSSETQGPTENGGGTEKELQRKIRQAVLDVIAQEKRLGGSLNKDNR